MITFDEQFLADLYASWARLRRRGPVHRAVTPDGAPVWLVVGDEHVRSLAADPRLTLDRSYSRCGYTGFSLPPDLDRNLLNMDGADHRRIRRQVAAGFTPTRVDALRPEIHAAATELAMDLQGQLQDGGPVDVIAEYASPFALRVIAMILGIPTTDLPEFRGWTDELLAPSSPSAAADAVKEIYHYIRDLIEGLRSEGDDSFLGRLTRNADNDPERLSAAELASSAFLLLFAGYENTIRVIGNGLIASVDKDGCVTVLREALTDEVSSRSVIDELLRYDPPPQLAIRRFACEDIMIDDVTILRGDTVMLSWASANRDPAAHPDPDRLQLDRNPNQHLTFGHGPHACLGSTLARVELEIGLTTLLAEIPTLRLVNPARPAWRLSFRNRGVTTLPVVMSVAGSS
ncbi:cytochrome P450 [Pseudonocardia sp. ICBG601]|uniref:cytochrome P450 n=1 Tax=Pseudonocardia sp. ICBG601 TaxID=2846759 RepID=UPI001CF7057B|nr:cytochrome P450 [Pseudonocardia sp. ICBG601]